MLAGSGCSATPTCRAPRHYHHHHHHHHHQQQQKLGSGTTDAPADSVTDSVARLPVAVLVVAVAVVVVVAAVVVAVAASQPVAHPRSCPISPCPITAGLAATASDGETLHHGVNQLV